MVFRWLFRFVALFLGRKAWEAFQRRRQRPSYAREPISGQDRRSTW